MVSPGQRVSIAVTKPAAGGRMLARVDGQVVLVAGAIPGEHVVATIERVGRGVAYARVIDVESASPDRRRLRLLDAPGRRPAPRRACVFLQRCAINHFARHC